MMSKPPNANSSPFPQARTATKRTAPPFTSRRAEAEERSFLEERSSPGCFSLKAATPTPVISNNN